MVICPGRGALGRWIYSTYQKIYDKCTKGFFQRTVTVLTTEIIGAKIAETAAPSALKIIDCISESYIPLYRELPLIGTGIGLILLARKSTRVGVAAITVSTATIAYIYSKDELAKITSQIAGTIVINLAQLFASIGGGYLGIALIYPEENFADYRENMVAHALAGRAFEITVATPSNFILKIPRVAFRAILQMVAYNRKPLWNNLKTIIRREPRYGIIIPTLTRTLFARYDTLNPEKFSGPIRKQLLKVIRDFLQSNSTEAVPLIKELTSESLNVLTRCIITYNARVSACAKLRSLFNSLQCCKDAELKKQIIQQFQTLLREKFPRTETIGARVLNIAGRKLIWNEENLDGLKKVLVDTLQDLGTFLVGNQPYPEEHLNFIQDLIQIHLKPFLFFAISHLIDKKTNRKPVEPDEELELAAILQQILYLATVDPILPKFLTSTLCKTSAFTIQALVQTVHILQGFQLKKSAVKENITYHEEFTHIPLEDAEPALLQTPIMVIHNYVPKPPNKDAEPALPPGPITVIDDYIPKRQGKDAETALHLSERAVINNYIRKPSQPQIDEDYIDLGTTD